MKRFIVMSVGTVALLAGNAYAEGCAYGKHKAAMADASETTEALNPELLALLKKQEEETLEESLVLPNIPN